MESVMSVAEPRIYLFLQSWRLQANAFNAKMYKGYLMTAYPSLIDVFAEV